MLIAGNMNASKNLCHSGDLTELQVFYSISTAGGTEGIAKGCYSLYRH